MRSTPLACAGLAALLLLAGCASRPTTAPVPAPSGSPAPTFSGLLTERQWLRQWFDGTPVRLADRDDGGLQLDVPLVHAFDGGAAEPRPALKAVLDKLAQSLQRQPGAQLQLGAPAPAARERVTAMRTHLGALGIGPSRLPATAATRVDMVLLRLAPGPVRGGEPRRALP